MTESNKDLDEKSLKKLVRHVSKYRKDELSHQECK